MTENVCKQVIVSGRVQGVFFRDSTKQVANELNLTGGVRNLRDGRVEIQVYGQDANVQTLIKWLKNGPKLAKVSNIEVIELKVLKSVSNQSLEQLSKLQSSQFEIWQTR